MRRLYWTYLYIFLLFTAGSAVFFVLPSLRVSISLSPDETAVATMARSFGTSNGMRTEDPLLLDYPWVHPRSFVTQGSALVPVGFLGFPAVLGLIWKILSDLGIQFFTPLLAVSVAFPFWRFAKKWGTIGQVVTVMTWLSYPTVILYANRGLFPNLPVVCLLVWAVWLIWEHRSWMRAVLAGICFGCAMAIRPIEAVWALPWMIVAWWSRSGAVKGQEKVYYLAGGASALAVLLAAMFLARETYGSFFAVGYALRDPVIGAVASSGTSSIRWPFGFHPAHIFFNVRSYYLQFLGPWILPAIIALVVRARKGDRALEVVFGWTFIAVTLLYGQSIYQDHVGLNVASTGNSFLRYVLPLAPCIALAIGSLVSSFELRLTRDHARTLALSIAAFLFLFGTWTAIRRDDEGLLADAQELQRYVIIRDQAIRVLPLQTIILSDRSDKIFYPVFRTASPLPDVSQIGRLIRDRRYPVAYFGNDDPMRRSVFAAAGLGMDQVFKHGNMEMFMLTSVSSTTRL